MARFAALLLVGLAVCVAAAAAANAVADGLHLIELDENTRKWMTEDEVLELIRAREATGEFARGFRDITGLKGRDRLRAFNFRKAFPTVPTQQATVTQLSKLMSASSLTSFLTEFSSFTNRYYTSTTGVESHIWLRDYMQAIANQAGRNDTVCTLFNHSWPQPSVICRVAGNGPNADEVVVCSAHSDSINSRSPVNGVAPGADDDGSGVADFVEVFRAIMLSGFRPSRTIDFIGYAAEEVGLRGSGAIAEDYVDRGVKVYGVYHNEMSGYPGRARSITILQDYVDTTLTRFLQSLVSVYTTLPYTTARCGYACSDHASWTEYGVPSICTAEAGPNGELNPGYHTANDDMGYIDASFSIEFAKLALGMTIELTEFRG